MLIEELKKEATKNAAEKKATDVHHRLIPMAVTNFTGRVFYGRRLDYSDPTLGSLVDAVFVLFRGTKSAAVEKIPFARFLPAVRRFFCFCLSFCVFLFITTKLLFHLDMRYRFLQSF